ncbi:MAG: hypothetical protein EOO45_00165 [Flavobacterium sp.]|nr:MAG: hypothetical protein EOO45_00165 [Flavobacterium sp.]
MNFKKIELERIFGYCTLASVSLVAMGFVWSISYAEMIHKNWPLTDMAYTYQIWIDYPFWKHFFLTFEQDLGGIEKHFAYHGYSTLYSFCTFLIVKVGHNVFHLPVATIDLLTPFIHGLLLAICLPFTFIYLFGGWLTRTVSGWIVLLLLQVTIVSLPIQYLYSAPAQISPLLSFWIINFVAVAYGQRKFSTAVFLTLSAIIGLQLSFMATVFGIIVFLAGLAEKRRELLYSGATLVGFGSLAYLIQKGIGALIGITTTGSSWASRSGLDGQTRFFSQSVNAIIDPIQRGWTRPYTLFWVAASFLVFLAFLIFMDKRKNHLGTLNGLFVLIGTYILGAGLIPQSYSLHPHMYDMLFSFPVFASLPFIFSKLSNEDDAVPSYTLWLIIILCGVINHNYIMINRAL